VTLLHPRVRRANPTVRSLTSRTRSWTNARGESNLRVTGRLPGSPGSSLGVGVGSISQTVRILQTGVGNVTWTATPNQPWITVTPTSGTGSATLTESVTFAPGLPVSGASSGAIALAVTNALNTPGPIAVGLTTIANGASAPPLGLMETPTDGSTGVTGSIAVTGWALDDIEVRAVRIVRDPRGG
jgi:hypothetical protein